VRALVKAAVTVSALFVATPAISQVKKPTGEIPNRQELAKVQTYCVNKSGLSNTDRYLIDGFVKTESKPKGLLTKLPWKLVADCRDGNPDATATLEFVPMNETAIRMGEPSQAPVALTPQSFPEAPIKVVLTVGDASSEKLLYRVQALAPSPDTPEEPPAMRVPVGPVEKRDAVYHVFWALIQDLQRLHSSSNRVKVSKHESANG
jgi:hypothetical protein